MISLTTFIVVLQTVLAMWWAIIKYLGPLFWRRGSLGLDDIAMDIVLNYLDTRSLESMVEARVDEDRSQEELEGRDSNRPCWDCENEVYVYTTDGLCETYATPCKCT